MFTHNFGSSLKVATEVRVKAGAGAKAAALATRARKAKAVFILINLFGFIDKMYLIL